MIGFTVIDMSIRNSRQAYLISTPPTRFSGTVTLEWTQSIKVCQAMISGSQYSITNMRLLLRRYVDYKQLINVKPCGWIDVESTFIVNDFYK